jgi:urease accessory protein
MNASPSVWRAKLELQFRSHHGRTVLGARKHEGPLVVQRPFHPEGPVCHVYLVHPPGGIVGGDELLLQVDAQPGSHTLITTPAATKFYRAGPHPRARLTQQIAVQDADFEWLPQESILFDGARAAARTEVRLHGHSRFIGWEVFCLGRPACDELFTTGSLHQDFLVWKNDVPLLFDRLRLDGGSQALDAGWGLAGATAFGTFLATPGTQDDLTALRQFATPGVRAALTLVDGLLHCRALATGSEALRQHFMTLWNCVRPSLLRRPAVPPRIWAT